MIKYSCIVVEDEPLAIEIMQDYIHQVPFLVLKKVCTDALEALEILHSEKIDLIFLDIHLPKLKGFDFLTILKHSPKVIITTAYHQYALKGYDFNVVDYLLKPIDLKRFLMAVNKINTIADNMEIQTITTERAHYFFNTGKKKVKIFLDEILYIEAQKEYIKIITTTKSLVTKFSLSTLEPLLPDNDFIRIHRSFIVSKNKIESYSIHDVDVGGKLIPIGRNYKEFVQSHISQQKQGPSIIRH